ncbi:MAG: peptidylprolyl isomerase [Jaaginema sp. PMC 1079.18]|nr:peptidylprolyl isomerase [Jaaginema sp. PMC 1080.18]MEC4852561.1 peptidylprolyl isomerase [Jaaginema sp. PMC 1079.18]MEC4865435.1 peptidylprolyl isomerase [Jaaginema sp. PMC 1078.18]
MITTLQVGDRTLNAKAIVELAHKYQLMPQLIREVIIDDAIASIEIEPEVINTACQNFFVQRQLMQPEAQNNWLQQQGLSLDRFQEKITRDLKIRAFKKQTWGKQLQSYFLKRKSQLDRVVYSLIRIQDTNLAQELYFRIQAGEATFAEVARAYSQGPEAQTGGIVGPVELVNLSPDIAELLDKSQIQQLWPPFQLGNWLIILRLEQKLPAQLNELTQQRLLDEFFDRWLQQEIAKANQIRDSKPTFAVVSQPTFIAS